MRDYIELLVNAWGNECIWETYLDGISTYTFHVLFLVYTRKKLVHTG